MHHAPIWISPLATVLGFTVVALTIEELTRALTEEEVFEKFLSILETIGLPARQWRKGGALRVIIRVAARIYAAFTVVMAAFIAAGFLETSTGEWLTRLAKYVYGVDRRAATHASEFITLTNAGGGLFEDQAIHSVTVVNPTTKKVYRNAEVFTLDPLSELDVLFEAVEEGSASSCAPGTITELETTLDQVTVTNPRSFIGLDAEDDADLRQACRDKLASLSVRGPRGAYAWAVREAKRIDGTPVNINRKAISTSSSKGQVTVVVAAPSGAPDPDDLTAIEDSVEQRARPDAVRVFVLGATEVLVERSLTIYAQRFDGVSEEMIRTLVEAAFLREGPKYRIGGFRKPPGTQGKVWGDWIVGVAKAAHPSIYEVDGEGDDLNLATAEVADFAITVGTVRLVEPADPS